MTVLFSKHWNKRITITFLEFQCLWLLVSSAYYLLLFLSPWHLHSRRRVSGGCTVLELPALQYLFGLCVLWWRAHAVTDTIINDCLIQLELGRFSAKMWVICITTACLPKQSSPIPHKHDLQSPRTSITQPFRHLFALPLVSSLPPSRKEGAAHITIMRWRLVAESSAEETFRENTSPPLTLIYALCNWGVWGGGSIWWS